MMFYLSIFASLLCLVWLTFAIAGWIAHITEDDTLMTVPYLFAGFLISVCCVPVCGYAVPAALTGIGISHGYNKDTKVLYIHIRSNEDIKTIELKKK